MSKILIFYFVFTFHAVFAQWSNQNNIPDYNYRDISFFENIGWIVGDNIVLKSEDNGKSWVVNSSPNGYCYAIKIIDESKCFVVGGKDNNSAFIKRTIDGGLNWEDVFSSNMSELHSICFTSDSVGFATGGYWNQNGYILKTYDSGNNWEVIIETSSNFKSIYFVDSNNGWAISQASFSGNSIIWKTIDGGYNWTKKYFQEYLNTIFFINSSTGWSTGISTDLGSNPMAKILKTIDSGNTWVEIFSENSAYNFQDVQFINTQGGWTIGWYGSIYFSNDGGINWYKQEVESNSTLNSIFMQNENIGWSVGRGTILKTTNGGITSIGGDNNEINLLNYELHQNYPNPFNPSTTISYTLPNIGFVQLNVYDMLGQEVAVLVNKKQTSGNYKVEFNANNLTSGIYFYRLQSGSFTETKKLILLR